MIKFIPFYVLIPNFITVTGLVIGISSIKYGLLGKWEVSVLCILIAAIIDGVDGRVARILNSSSKFGSELDSLCDLANFGVAPAILIYLWAFDHYEFHLISWGSVMFFTSCIAIRLAKFNLLNDNTLDNTLENNDLSSDSVPSPPPKISKKETIKWFYGVPAPSAAFLILVPIMLEFNFTNLIGSQIRGYKIFLNLYILFIGFLAAGNFRTISLKNFKIKKDYLSLIMSTCIILFIVTILYPWYILPIIGVLYLINIPVYIIILRSKHIKK